MTVVFFKCPGRIHDEIHRLHDYEAQGLYSNPVQYYDFLQNRVMILFKPKFDEADAEHPEFHLTLSKKQNYDIVRRI